MEVKNTEKGLMPIVFSQENKLKMMKEILGNLLTQGNHLLAPRENNILRWLLVEDKNIKEVSEKLELTVTRTHHVFTGSIKRICSRCLEAGSMFQNYRELEKEVSHLTNQLNNYKIKERNSSLLSSETIELLKMTIFDTDLSTRLKNSLRYANIDTVAELVKMSKRDLQGYRNVGKNTINEVEDFFKQNKLSWSMRLMDI